MRPSFNKIIPQQLSGIVQVMLKDEAIGGKLLLVAAVLALVVVNSPLRTLYESFWNLHLSVGIADISFSETLRLWVNDGLMALFFLVVGLEVKREFVRGELRNRRSALLPIGAALGGMVLPALIYLLFNIGSPAANGWGIPIATDIAFAIGVLSLLGSRVPLSLKLFLLTLAIVDDLLAIAVIAFAYTSNLNVQALLIAAGVMVLLAAAIRYQKNNVLLFSLLGIGLWAAVQTSGIHATIAGALLGFMAPLRSVGSRKSIAERLERSVIPLSTFIVIPLFAFANAGVVFSAEALSSEASRPVVLGIFLGLVVGKVLGVLLAVWLLVKLRITDLPLGANWGHIAGVGFLAGIGFTVSIFITELAFSSDAGLISSAKISIIIASVAAAILGSMTLLLASRSEN